MKKLGWLACVALLLAVFAAGCHNHRSAGGGAAIDDDGSPSDDDDDNDAGPDDDASPEYVTKYEFNLALEVQFAATLKMALYPDGHLNVALIPQQGFDVLSAGAALLGSGETRLFPEANARMIALLLNGPSVPGGKCGDQPISYAVSLTATLANPYMVGALTAYCGANTYTGEPARVMRLAGWQQQIE
jgi:hypothetical protein